MSPTSASSRLVLILLALVIPGSVVLAGSGLFGGATPFLGLGLLFAAVVYAVRRVDGFGRAVGAGALAGLLAGGLVLGVGFRVAMRVVAVLDPVRRPDFSVGGTMFIVIGLGVILGGLLAVSAAVLRLGFRWRPVAAGSVLGLLVMGLVFASDDLRSELFELGAGAWMNIPMFGSVALAYGLTAARIVGRRVGERAPAAAERAGVPA